MQAIPRLGPSRDVYRHEHVPRPRARRFVVVGLSLLLFAGIYSLRLVDHNAADAVALLFVVPVAFCAIEFGTRGGIAAGVVALALTLAWDLTSDIAIGPLGYLARAASFFLLGGLLGRFVSRRMALEKMLMRYRESSLDLIATADFRGYFTELNPAWEKVLGYPEDELLTKPFLEFVHPDDIETTQAETARLASDDTATINFRNRYRTRDGSYRWLEWNARSSPEEENIYAIARDITEHKETADAIEGARQEAQRANRAKSEFLSRMSHELRTPLNAILGFGQLLEMDDLGDEQREHVAQILKGGRHLLELIDEVLDISRIEAGNMTISLEPVHVGTAISDAVELVAPLAAKRGISIQAPPPEEADRYVRADNQRLKQVLLNLLSNAIKYNREQGSVTISLEGAATDCLLILVTDTGKGISEDQLTKLFSPFDRLGAERGPVEGTGLGLALSKLLVTAMDGTLGVESQPWIGSTFIVKLTQAEAPLARVGDAAVRPEQVQTNGSPGPVQTILYIEDNLSNYKLVERVFANRPDVRLITAIEGKIGLELARRHKPDLVLLDLHLPGMPGEQILERLKEDPGTRDTPIVVVSADATERRIKRLLEAGATAYLTKPLDIQNFRDVIDEALRERVGA